MADAARRDEALTELAAALDLPRPPERIECYDMSNIQGTSAVGSMVVFIDGKPEPREYRRFRIRSARPPDDFRMMAEVLRRRFSRVARLRNETGALSLAAVGADEAPEGEREDGELLDLEPNAGPIDDESAARARREAAWTVPSLVIVDGGRGQLSAAVGALSELASPTCRCPASRSASRSSTCRADPPRSCSRAAPRRCTSSSASATRRIGSRSPITATSAASGRCDPSSTSGRHRSRSEARAAQAVRIGSEDPRGVVDDVAATPGISRDLAERLKAHLAREGMLA